MPGEFHLENENVNHRKKITKKLEKISTQNKRVQMVRLFKKAQFLRAAFYTFRLPCWMHEFSGLCLIKILMVDIDLIFLFSLTKNLLIIYFIGEEWIFEPERSS